MKTLLKQRSLCQKGAALSPSRRSRWGNLGPGLAAARPAARGAAGAPGGLAGGTDTSQNRVPAALPRSLPCPDKQIMRTKGEGKAEQERVGEVSEREQLPLWTEGGDFSWVRAPRSCSGPASPRAHPQRVPGELEEFQLCPGQGQAAEPRLRQVPVPGLGRGLLPSIKVPAVPLNLLAFPAFPQRAQEVKDKLKQREVGVTGALCAERDE